MEETGRLTESVKQLLGEGRDERLADLLEDAHPADVSRVIRELPHEDQIRVFRLLAPQRAGEVLAELDDRRCANWSARFPRSRFHASSIVCRRSTSWTLSRSCPRRRQKKSS